MVPSADEGGLDVGQRPSRGPRPRAARCRAPSSTARFRSERPPGCSLQPASARAAGPHRRYKVTRRPPSPRSRPSGTLAWCNDVPCPNRRAARCDRPGGGRRWTPRDGRRWRGGLRRGGGRSGGGGGAAAATERARTSMGFDDGRGQAGRDHRGPRRQLGGHLGAPDGRPRPDGPRPDGPRGARGGMAGRRGDPGRRAPATDAGPRSRTRGAPASNATATASCTPPPSAAWPARPRSSSSPTTTSAPG